MADISLQGVYAQKRRQFRVLGSGSDRFQPDFVDACNDAIARINRQADLATRISRATKPEGTIDLDDAYTDVFSDLVTMRLMDLGQRPSQGMEIDYAELSKNMDDRIDSIRQDVLNQAIAADTDDETDFVGLGARG